MDKLWRRPVVIDESIPSGTIRVGTLEDGANALAREHVMHGIDIDWTKLSEQTITCRCGWTYRTKAKVIYANEEHYSFTELPCQSCGASSNHVRRIKSDPVRKSE